MTAPVEDLRSLFASRHGLVLASARDEGRLKRTIESAAASLNLPVWVWSAARGLRAIDHPNAQMNTTHPAQALKFLAELKRPFVAVLLDSSLLFDDPVALRLAKEIAADPGINQTLVITGAPTETPEEFVGVAVNWDLAPPDREEMRAVVERTLAGLRNSRLQVQVDNVEDLINSVIGLTEVEAERLIMRETVDDGMLDGEDAKRIQLARAEILSADSPLDLMDPGVTLDDVAGLDNLKSWLKVRGRGFEPEAQAFGLEAPKGVVLAGIPGCGKSLVSRAIAGSWGMSLAALDTGRLHGSFVGESEKRLRHALNAAEAIAPVVLWIDEVEKAFSKPGSNDGGASSRVLGVLLRWLQERPEGVFVVATTNDVEKLAAEVTRRGRFDEVFFVDLPTAEERSAILLHHLKRRKRDPRAFQPAPLIEATEGFSGSEIESALTAALYEAYASGAQLDTDRLLAEFHRTVPLSRMRAADVEAMRAWGRKRARPASSAHA